MIGMIEEGIRKLKDVDELRDLIGQQLTPIQQMAISQKLHADKIAFHRWLMTDPGRAATRTYAEAFIAPDVKTPPEGGA